jgi:hypothetical protein
MRRSCCIRAPGNEVLQRIQHSCCRSPNTIAKCDDSPVFLLCAAQSERRMFDFHPPITEWNELFAGLLLKAHKMGAAFCWVWLRLN